MAVKGIQFPYSDYLGKEQGMAFEREITERAKTLYSVLDSGEVLLGFRRFFFVDTR